MKIVTVFGYPILISINFYDLLARFLPIFRMRRYIKHSRQVKTVFDRISKHLRSSSKILCVSTLFSGFGNLVKHALSCLIYYFQNSIIARDASYAFRNSIFLLTSSKYLAIRHHRFPEITCLYSNRNSPLLFNVVYTAFGSIQTTLGPTKLLANFRIHTNLH